MVFRNIQNPNLFIWNTIIRGFSESPSPEIAISLFIDMLVTSAIELHRLTYPSVFKAYAQLGLAQDGAQLHGRIVKLGLESDQFIRNTIIHMYANCGFLSEVRRLFNEGLECDTVAWNSMIMGLSKWGVVSEAKRLFDKFSLRNSVSWNSMISVLLGMGSIQRHWNFFSYPTVLMSNVYAASSQFQEAMKERLSMKQQKIEKEPGCSLIEVDGEVHEFIAGGRLHHKAPEIYSLLNELGFILPEMAKVMINFVSNEP
ncbi:pentatricopeptide repeat-containing protein [Prunus yedoensis var. nudiflora]|uniref:Pentatricopeptide repeat-containing protein n=1 Tax=Prunus yedoensis var. nudiflora TaxID=2094558 RepID=A0A314UL17_PRUYE|nr:pentatricopeptide repeat-containing protein [Prunus yedoensis var. nudiflora]